MPSTQPSPGNRVPPLVISLLAGVSHAVLLLGVALHLGYAVGPASYSPIGASWRYGDLVVVAALPVWLALRHQVVTPLLALLLTTGYVLGTELAPPGPTFRDVAELEGLAEPTGIMVVENGLYVVRYMVNASVWTICFLFVGLLETVARRTWSWLPAVPTIPSWVTQRERRQVAVVATAAGVLHAVVMVWYALRLGLGLGGGPDWTLYAFVITGMWLLAAVPIYLLLRHRLFSPATLLTAFAVLDVQGAFTASVEDPHALYVGAWFFLLALALLAGGLEVSLRRLELRGR